MLTTERQSPDRSISTPWPTAKAYLICLWGSSPEYMLGAMVLGASIRKTKSKHDRVCLFTDDVPEAPWVYQEGQGWECVAV